MTTSISEVVRRPEEINRGSVKDTQVGGDVLVGRGETAMGVANGSV